VLCAARACGMACGTAGSEPDRSSFRHFFPQSLFQQSEQLRPALADWPQVTDFHRHSQPAAGRPHAMAVDDGVAPHGRPWGYLPQVMRSRPGQIATGKWGAGFSKPYAPPRNARKCKEKKKVQDFPADSPILRALLPTPAQNHLRIVQDVRDSAAEALRHMGSVGTSHVPHRTPCCGDFLHTQLPLCLESMLQHGCPPVRTP
jgi:hypothetical protein